MKLVLVRITTHMGEEYAFPDMDADAAARMVQELQLAHPSQLTLANQSTAVLVVPFRIVATISVDGEERWHAPASR